MSSAFKPTGEMLRVTDLHAFYGESHILHGIEVVLMTLMGGLGTVLGPVAGAATIIGLENLLADKVGSWVTVIMGGMFVVCVLLFRRGMVGELVFMLNKNGLNRPGSGGH